MKKIYFILLILISSAIISCNNSSSGDLPEGFVDPFSSQPYVPNADKYSNIPGVGCSTKTCNAVIYQGSVDGRSQVGIAVYNSPTSNLKIYWDASAINSVNIPPTEYTIKVISSGIQYISLKESPTATGNLNITITPNSPSDGIYTIAFNGTINIGGFAINSTHRIQANKYPEPKN